jgi:expansin (peptidoglycan-binding protein)
MHPLILYILFLCMVTAAQINYDAGVQQGRITFYSQSATVACDIPQSEWPQYTTALDEKHFQAGLACGATVRLMNNRKEIQAMVVDLCPVQGNEQWCSGDMTHFDLGGQNTFAQLEPPDTGVKVIQFQWIPTPVGDSPVKLRLKDGINAYWMAIEVINHRYPIAKLEIKDPQTGAWIAGDRTKPGMYNYWQFSFTGNGLQAPFQIRITDQFGQVIEETGPVIQEKYMWTGTNQFPLRSSNGTLQGSLSSPGVSERVMAYIMGNKLYTAALSPVYVRIYDSAGRIRAATSLPEGAASVALPEIAAGVYLVKLTAGNAVVKRLWIKGIQ